MGELARDQIADGDQMASGAIATCFGLGRHQTGLGREDLRGGVVLDGSVTEGGLARQALR